MPSATNVVGRLIVAASIIMIKHKVFALMSDSFGDTTKFARMLSDHKRARIERDDDASDVYEPALVVNTSRVLRGTDSYIW